MSVDEAWPENQHYYCDPMFFFDIFYTLVQDNTALSVISQSEYFEHMARVVGTATHKTSEKLLLNSL